MDNSIEAPLCQLSKTLTMCYIIGILNTMKLKPKIYGQSTQFPNIRYAIIFLYPLFQNH